MAYTSEIEKLERRWAENPKGRNFAPLADAYRKAGELDRALELCTAGLERHPDYVSAHIVYGRCLIDQKNDAGASDVFRKVLTLDPENVLALKILADIAERAGRFDEAVEWLTRLLAADPMNGDAAEALAQAKGKAARPAPPPPPPPPPPAPPPPTPQPDLVVEHEVPTTTELQAKPEAAEFETFDGTLDFNSVAHDAAKAQGLEVQEEVELKASEIRIEGLAATQYESGAFLPPPEAAEPGIELPTIELSPEAPGPEDELPAVDLPLIMPDDVGVAPPASAPEPPLPAAPGVAEAARPSAAAQRARAASGRSASPPGGPPPAAVVLSDDDGAADTAALSRAEPVLTETMAELYLRQGHQEDALRVYQALLAQRPTDARLRARVASLTPRSTRGGKATGESVQAFLKRLLAARPRAAASSVLPAPPAPAAPTAPPPDASLENAFAPASPEPEPEIVAPRAATRPAEDTFSLDAVFGDEGMPSPRSGRDTPAEPAARAGGAASPQSPPTGGFSFDQFFHSPVEPASGGAASPLATPTPAPAPLPAPGPPSGSQARAPVDDEDDLDQFQAWLRGLKP